MKATYTSPFEKISKYVRVPADGVFLLGDLEIPELAETLVIFAYDFGEIRNHPRAPCRWDHARLGSCNPLVRPYYR